MGTINKYFPSMPDKYRVSIEDNVIVDEIAQGLDFHFGHEWGGFSKQYVLDSIDDRLVSSAQVGGNRHMRFHMRIFDRDFDGKQCFGVGGVFKWNSGDSKDVEEVYGSLFKYCSKDICIGIGLAHKKLSDHYMNNILRCGHYTDYDDDYQLYYVEFNNYRITDEDIGYLKTLELF